jgi:hypothetical protein
MRKRDQLRGRVISKLDAAKPAGLDRQRVSPSREWDRSGLGPVPSLSLHDRGRTQRNRWQE